MRNRNTRNTFKKITALFLAVCMLIPQAGMTAFAEETSRDESTVAIEETAPGVSTESEDKENIAADDVNQTESAQEADEEDSDADAEELRSETSEEDRQSDTNIEEEKSDAEEVKQSEVQSDENTEEPSEEEIKMPAQTMKAETEEMAVLASWDENIFPEDVTMVVRKVNAEQVKAAAGSLLGDDSEVVDAIAVDITFYSFEDGKHEVQPKDPSGVHVSINAKRAIEGEWHQVVHIDKNGNAESVTDATETGASFDSVGFSIYAIIGTDGFQEGDTVRRFYHFWQYNVQKDLWFENTDQVQIIKNGDTLVEPKAPMTTAAKDDRRFEGWVYHEDDPAGRWRAGDKVQFAVVDDIDINATEDESVRIDAKFEDALKVEFFDGPISETDPPAIIEVKEGVSGDVISAEGITIDSLEDTKALVGWEVHNRAEEKIGEIDIDGSVTLSNLTLRLYPIIKDAVWVHFVGNASDASYTPSVKTGQNLTISKPETDPKRTGYTFAGWYTQAEGGELFDFDDTKITAETTLYAHWTPLQVKYRVFIWRETLSDELGRAREGETTKYELVYSYEATAPAGTKVSYQAARNSFFANVPQSVQESELLYTDEPADISDFDGTTEGEELVVKGDGSSIFNAYFDLHEYTLEFNPQRTGNYGTLTHDGRTYNRNNHYSFTAKIGEDILAKWPKTLELNSGNTSYRATGWKHSDQSATYSTARHRLTPEMLDKDAGGAFKQTTLYTAQYSNQANTAYRITYELQNVSGTGYTASAEYYEEVNFTSNATVNPKNIDGYTYVSTPVDKQRVSNDVYRYTFRYDRNKYDLVFNNYNVIDTDHGGTFVYEADISGKDYVPEKPAELADYYTFTGWYLEREHQTKFDFTDATMPSGNLTLYAGWEKTNVNVSFDLDGGEASVGGETPATTLDDVTIPAESKLGYNQIPSTPTKAGMIFGGWEIDGMPINLEDHVFTEDTTIKAKWPTIQKYHIRYMIPDEYKDQEKGTVPDEVFDVEDGAHMFIRAFDSDCATGNFLGWTIEGDSHVYHDNDLFTVDAEKMADGDTIYLYATYGLHVPILTQLRFNGNGGKTTNGEEEIVHNSIDDGTSLDLQNDEWITPGKDAFIRLGYEIVSWNTKPDGSGVSFDLNKSIGADKVSEETDNVLYAQWRAVPVDYTIRHYVQRVNGDTETADTDISYNGKKYRLANSFTTQAVTGSTVEAFPDTPDGYKIDWDTTAGYEGNEDNTVENGKVSGTVKGDGSLTLNFLYSPVDYRVYYHYRGTVPGGVSPAEANVEDYDSATYQVGQTVSVKADAIAPAGYTFSGWATEKIAVDDNEFTMPARDVNIYGSFSPNTNTEYTIRHYYECLDQNATGEGIVEVNGVKYEIIPGQDYTKTGTTGQEGIAQSKTFPGFTFNKDATTAYKPSDVSAEEDGEQLTLSGTIAGDGSLVLSFFYDRNTYNITYHYEGYVPNTADPVAVDLEAAPYKKVNVKYGETVQVAPDASGGAHYTFSGWKLLSPIDGADTGEFLMPARDVNFYGTFEGQGNTPFKIYYFMEVAEGGPESSSDPALIDTIDGKSYELPTDHDHGSHIAELTGEANQSAVARAQSYEGFAINWDATKASTYNTNNPLGANTVDENAGTVTGTIHGDESLILAIYYDRREYKVDYEYYGTVPDGAGEEPDSATYKLGAGVTVADEPVTPAGYKFVGWETSDVTVDSDSIFTMPSHDVHLRGHFEPINSQYRIEHYIENADSDDAGDTVNYTIQESDTETKKAVTGTHVNATGKAGGNYAGLSVHDGLSNMDGLVTGYDADTGTGEELVLKVYYKRNEWKVTYQYGSQPKDQTLTPPAAETHKMGSVVALAQRPEAPVGYEFIGWTGQVIDSDAYDEQTDSFTMPNRDVLLVGNFVPVTSPYRVEHYWQKVDQSGYEENPHETEEFSDAETGVTVTATRKNYQGMTFNETKSAPTQSGIVTGYNPDGKTDEEKGVELVLKLYYDRQELKTTYQYRNTVPGASALPATETHVSGEEGITPADKASAVGYSFKGWYLINTQDVDADKDLAGNVNKYTMPARNLILQGEFEALKSPYKVEHYKQNEDGSWPSDPSDTDEIKNQKTGTEVTAASKSYEGFTFDDSVEGTKLSGTVTGYNPDGVTDAEKGKELVLKLYYTRNSHKVSYTYRSDKGDRPVGQIEVPEEETHPFGEDVIVAEKLSVPGYTFKGWYRSTLDSIFDMDVKSFPMPDEDVELEGWFTANSDTSYLVQFFYMREDGTYGDTPDSQESRTGKTDTIATVADADRTPTKDGYVFDPGAPNVLSGNINGDGSRVLKIHFKTQYTVRYLPGTHGMFSTDVDGETRFTGLSYGEDTPDYEGPTSSADSDTSYTPKGNPGYEFAGWSPAVEDVVTKSVDYTAQWRVAPVRYTIRHYVERVPGDTQTAITDIEHGGKTYRLVDSYQRQGNTEATVSAVAHHFDGYEIDWNATGAYAGNSSNTVADEKVSGTVAGDGSLVLSLLYQPLDYQVIYHYNGTVPAGVDPTSDDIEDYDSGTYNVGQKVEIKADPTPPAGYTFSGWQPTEIDIKDGSFTMPARDVNLYGSFVAVPSKYTVEFYKMKNGGYGVDPDDSDKREGLTAETVEVTTADKAKYEEEGFVLDSDATQIESGAVLGDGSLILKLYFKPCDPVKSNEATDPDGNPVKHDPPAKKVLTGDKPETEDSFVFELKSAGNTAGLDENPMPEGADGQSMQIEVKAGEEREFGVITFTRPGTYSYRVTEVNTGLAGYTYDTSVYTATYVVTQNGTSLEAERIFQKDGEDVSVAEFVFENSYKKDESKDDPKKQEDPPQNDDPKKDSTPQKDDPKKDSTPQKEDPKKDTTSQKEDPDKPDEAKKDASSNDNKHPVVNTGDESNIMLWFILMIASLTLLILAGYMRRRDEPETKGKHARN